jgi:zinc transport system permease protein
VAVGLAPRMFAVCYDEEYARAGGMNVLGLNLLLAVLTATTVVISMRVVGLLLISALMIVPNAVAQQVARSFRGSMVIAAVVGVSVSVTGTASSYYLETPSGGTIVLLAVAVFIIAALGATTVRAVHARRHHTADDHRHEHGIDCGHEIVPHDDHLDYVHDGHRHAAHGAHYDDH